MKPSHKKPYYYIINHNKNNENENLENTNVIPTNLEMDTEIKEGSYKPSEDNVELEYGTPIFLKDQYNRTVNQSTVKIDIHTGDSS